MNAASLLEYLKEHTGESNAVKSKTLETLFRCSGAVIRNTVNDLRSQGFPICSSNEGYYYAQNNSDVRKTLFHLKNRIAGIQNAIAGLELYLDESYTPNDFDTLNVA